MSSTCLAARPARPVARIAPASLVHSHADQGNKSVVHQKYTYKGGSQVVELVLVLREQARGENKELAEIGEVRWPTPAHADADENVAYIARARVHIARARCHSARTHALSDS